MDMLLNSLDAQLNMMSTLQERADYVCVCQIAHSCSLEILQWGPKQ